MVVGENENEADLVSFKVLNIENRKIEEWENVVGACSLREMATAMIRVTREGN